MNIALDMMGGDYAPLQAVKGVAEYLATNPTDIHLTLIGNQPQIEECILSNPLPTGTFTIVHAQQVIEMNEHPTKALKEKQQSSIALGFNLLATAKIIATNFKGVFPNDYETLLTLKGVGPYTAAAIASFAVFISPVTDVEALKV